MCIRDRSVAVCLDNLDVTEVIVPVLCEGRGTVRCQHGILPIPVPAVANILSANHLHLKMTEVEGELVTPTGAAKMCIRDSIGAVTQSPLMMGYYAIYALTAAANGQELEDVPTDGY